MEKINESKSTSCLVAAFINKQEGSISEILIDSNDTQSLLKVSKRLMQPLAVAITSMFSARRNKLIAYHLVHTDHNMDLSELLKYQEDIQRAVTEASSR